MKLLGYDWPEDTWEFEYRSTADDESIHSYVDEGHHENLMSGEFSDDEVRCASACTYRFSAALQPCNIPDE